MTVMDMLNLIRRSLSYKFKGFKYHFHMFQNDLIETEGFQISKDKIINRLKQYPFFMDDNNIEGLLEYVFS